MPRAKKKFDREDMYKRIMPSASKQEQQEIEDELGEAVADEIMSINNAKSGATNDRDSRLISNNRELTLFTDTDVVVYNITERLVAHRLDIALAKISCCRCDRCKKDILALSLNSLKPQYIVCPQNEIELKMLENEHYGLTVTSAILRAILQIRKTPRH